MAARKMADEEIDVGTPERSSSTFDRKVENDKAKFQLERSAADRDERLRRNMLVMAVVFFWLFSMILVLAVFVLAWHKIAPEWWEFLTPNKVDSIQIFLIGSALMAFLMLLINKISTYLYNKNR